MGQRTVGIDLAIRGDHVARILDDGRPHGRPIRFRLTSDSLNHLVARLRDGQLGDERVHDIGNYIRRGKLWDTFTSPTLPVLLIDEIDKADIEFPNDLLQELDRMSFDVYETGERVGAVGHRCWPWTGSTWRSARVASTASSGRTGRARRRRSGRCSAWSGSTRASCDCWASRCRRRCHA